MSKKTTTEAQPAKQGKELMAPFNYSHSSSRCPLRPTSLKSGMPHKFKTTSRRKARPNVFAVTLTCTFCGGFTRTIEDYTVTAGIFSV